MIEREIKARIAGKTITVPVYRDRRTTLRLIQRLNQRIQEIEKESDRIDTQAFALQAALSFAAELTEIEAEQEEETTQVFNDLDNLSKTLEHLLNEYGITDR